MFGLFRRRTPATPPAAPAGREFIRASELADGDYVHDFGPRGYDGAMLGDAGYATITGHDHPRELIEVRSTGFGNRPGVWTMHRTDWVEITHRDNTLETQ